MDPIFKALNDPTRRALLDALRLRDGQTLTELETNLAMTRFGVMKHLAVLETAGLVLTRKVGRFKYHYLNAAPLQEVVDRWVEPLLQRPMACILSNLKNQLEGHPMTNKPDFMMQTYIRCTQDALWDALTDPSLMSLWNPMAGKIMRDGNRVVYKFPDGRPMLVETDVQMTPKTRIESTFEPLWAGPDTPHSRFVYLIAAEGAQCKLTIEHYDLTVMQDGIADGWVRVLSALKTWLETGIGTEKPAETAA